MRGKADDASVGVVPEDMSDVPSDKLTAPGGPAIEEMTDKPSSTSGGSSFGEVLCGPLGWEPDPEAVAFSFCPGTRVDVAERVRVLWARWGRCAGENAIDLGVRRIGLRRLCARARASFGGRLTLGRENGSEERRRKEKSASRERTSVKMNDQTLSKNAKRRWMMEIDIFAVALTSQGQDGGRTEQTRRVDISTSPLRLTCSG